MTLIGGGQRIGGFAAEFLNGIHRRVGGRRERLAGAEVINIEYIERDVALIGTTPKATEESCGAASPRHQREGSDENRGQEGGRRDAVSGL